MHIMKDGSNSPRRGTTRINQSTLTNLKNETLLGQEDFGLKLSCLSIIPYYICKLEKLKKKNFFEKKKKINLVYVERWPPKCASWVGDGKPNG